MFGYKPSARHTVVKQQGVNLITTTENIEGDLNKTIATAVMARVEAEVAKALSGDEFMGRMITAALTQKISVKRGYRDEQVSYIHEMLFRAVQEATKTAVQKVIQEEIPSLEAEVRKALRRNLTGISEALSKNLTDSVAKGYGINVNLELKVPRDY